MPGKQTIKQAVEEAVAPSRTTPTQVYNAQTISPSSSVEFTVNDGEGYSALIVTVKATYNASATSGLRVRWLYSPDGTTYDSEEDAENQGNYEDLTFSAGNSRVRTITVPLFQPYVKVQIVNQDATYSTTVDAWKTLIR
jgi:hypothetical protein